MRNFAVGIIFLLLATTGITYWVVTELKEYDDTCTKLGGVPVHGQGIDLCLKPEVLLGNDNG